MFLLVPRLFAWPNAHKHIKTHIYQLPLSMVPQLSHIGMISRSKRTLPNLFIVVLMAPLLIVYWLLNSRKVTIFCLITHIVFKRSSTRMCLVLSNISILKQQTQVLPPLLVYKVSYFPAFFRSIIVLYH